MRYGDESAWNLPLGYLVAKFGATVVIVSPLWIAVRATLVLSANE
jgi:hypothetical protein